MTMTKSYAAQAGAPLILPSSLTLIVNLPSTRIDPKPCMCAALTYESDVIRSLQTYLYQASLDRRIRKVFEHVSGSRPVNAVKGVEPGAHELHIVKTAHLGLCQATGALMCGMYSYKLATHMT